MNGKEGSRKLLKENKDLVWEVLMEDSGPVTDLLEKRTDVVIRVISFTNVATKRQRKDDS